MVLGRVRHYGVPAAGLIAFVATTDSIKRGKPKIIDGGYAYVNDKNGLGTADWR